MKAFAFVCALLLVGAQADTVKVVDSPTFGHNILETVKVVETPTFYRGILEILVDLVQTVGGFLESSDPLSTDYYQLNFDLAGLLNLGFSVENLAFAGFSDLEVTQATLDNDVLSLDVAFVNVWVSTDLFRLYAGSANAEVSGSLALGNLGFVVDINLDTSDGLTIVDFDLTLKTPSISALIRAQALGTDYTDFLLELLNDRVPAWIEENGSAVGDVIRNIIWRIIESIRENSY